MTQVKTAHGHSSLLACFFFLSLFPTLSLEAFVVVGKAFSLFTGLNTVSCVYCESTFVACVYVAGVISFLVFCVAAV